MLFTWDVVSQESIVVGKHHPLWAWVRTHWLDFVIPAAVFLVSAGIYREMRWGQQVRRQNAWEGHFNSAATLQNAKKPEQALKELLAASEVAPDDADVHRELAKAFQGVRLPDKATHHMELALKFDKPNRSAALNLAKVYCNLSRFSDAQRILRLRVVAQGPKDAETWYLEGLVALYGGAGDGRPSDAERSFAEVLRVQPDHVNARFHHGISLARLKRPGDAENEFRRVVQASPAFVGAYKELAESLRKQGKAKEAEKLLARLQALDDIDQSVKYIETRRSTGKVPPEDLLELGRLYLSVERLSEAEGALAHYVLLRPTDARAHRLLAQVHGKMKLSKNAAADLELATALEKRSGEKR